ncbi:MAG: hypothetical protein OXS29_13630 [bacterium]|nr:hypothetical protein [bacterium]MDE0289567.1 hypothetical protein [bacterium]
MTIAPDVDTASGTDLRGGASKRDLRLNIQDPASSAVIRFGMAMIEGAE